MPNKDNKILEYNQEKNSLKFPFMIYADLEVLLEKCILAKITRKSLTQRKKIMHIPSSYSLFTNRSLDETKNKRDCYRGKDCVEKFCKDLRDHASKIINCEGKEMILLSDKETKFYEKQKVYNICKEGFSTDKNDKNAFKLYHKVRDHCNYTGKFRGAAHSICNLRYKTPKEISVVIHNGSTYDHHFIIEHLAK